MIYLFYDFTVNLLEKDNSAIYKIFNIYNALLDHIKNNISYLQFKWILWKQQVYTLLKKTIAKLYEYYNKIY